MTDKFAPPTKDELERAKAFAPPSEEELSRYRSPTAGMSPVDKAFKAVEDTGGKAIDAVMASPVGKGLAWVGDKLERYVDAPIRAQITSLQKGESVGRSYQRGGEQMGKDQLPTTRSGKEIGQAIGITDKPMSEFFPNAFSETGDGIKLQKGGILDFSPAGAYGAVIQPSNLIPGEVLVGSGAKGVKALGAAAAKTAPVVEFVEAAGKAKTLAGKAGQAAQRGVFKTGEVLTRGTLKADDAIAAANQLKGTQLLLPEAYTRGAGKKVGAARDAIEGSGKVLPDQVAARAQLEEIREMVIAGQNKAAKTPGSEQLKDRIDRALENPNGIEVENIDDMVQDLNGIEYTEKGNERSIERRWSKPLAQIRGKLEPMLGTTDEGAALSSAKKPFSALQDAKGKKRSGLASIASWTGGVGSAAIATALSNPVIGAAALVASRAIAPRTYFQIVGAAKLPKQVADGLVAAYQTGSQTKIAQAIKQAAVSHPQEIARMTNLLANEADAGLKAAQNDDGPVERRLRRLGE